MKRWWARDRILVMHYAPALGEPYRLSFVAFCEIVDEVIPEIVRMQTGRPRTALERLAEREKRKAHALPPSRADGLARQRRRRPVPKKVEATT